METFTYGNATLYCGDCRTLDIKADAVCTDPPWGIGNNTDYTRFTFGLSPARNFHLGIAGDDRPFDPSWMLAYKRIALFGFQYMAASLPVGSVLCWIKKRDNQIGTFCSDAELCWFNRGKGCYVYRHVWNGFDRETERGKKTLHPNQKPVELWKHIFGRLGLKEGQTVYDPYCGSASVGVACLQSGLNYVGVEMVPEYFDVACSRIIQQA